MNPRLYDRITIICMVVALVSALLFDRTTGIFQILALMLGIGVGAISVTVYFYNQSLRGWPDS